jgi:hypothetical protein
MLAAPLDVSSPPIATKPSKGIKKNHINILKQRTYLLLSSPTQSCLPRHLGKTARGFDLFLLS